MDFEQDEFQTPTYEGMSEEEKKETAFYKRAVRMRIAVWVIMIVFVGSVLINAISIYFH